MKTRTAVSSVLLAMNLIAGCSAASRDRSNSSSDSGIATERTYSVAFRRTPLVTAIDTLRRQSNSNIFVNWRVLESAGVCRDTAVDVTLRDQPLSQVLELVLADAAGGSGRLAYETDDHGVLRISTAADLDRAERTTEDREAWRSIRKRSEELESRVIQMPSGATRLDQALEQWTQRAGIPLHVNWPSIEEAGIARDVRFDVVLPPESSASDALRHILKAAGGDNVQLGFATRANGVQVATREELNRRIETRVYDVRDLLPMVSLEKENFYIASATQPTPAQLDKLYALPS